MSNDLHARYEAAERLLPHQWKRLVFSGRVKANWVPGTDRFWYANCTRAGTEYVAVDPVAARRETFVDRAAAVRAVSGNWEGGAGPGELPAEVPDDMSISPDGRWAVVVRDHNLVRIEPASGLEHALTSDGTAAHAYATPPDISVAPFTAGRFGLKSHPAVAWSPDSRRLVTHRIDQRALPLMHLVQSSPDDGGRPRLFSERYAMVGEDAVATVGLLVIDIESGRIVRADASPFFAPFQSPVASRHVWWDRAGRWVHFIAGTRGDRCLTLHSMNPETGAVSTLLEEIAETQVQTHPIYGSAPNAHVLASGEVIWWSERSGWGHVYLVRPGGTVRAVTSGGWLVRDLVSVDEDARRAVFTASGREPDLDPYVRQLYRVSLDGGPVERLTTDALDHDVTASPTGGYLVDVASWLDAPATSSLLDAAGRTVLQLEQADAELLYEAGWQAPERFSVKAADGTTDLYGLLFQPHGFDPAGRYPVLDDIYPGPQVHHAFGRFPRSGGFAVEYAASMAALGFAVVVLDARGTPLRGKAFQEHCRGSREDDNLADHVAAIRRLAEMRPWLDTDRVGIYGYSGGGRAAARAILQHPAFFKVAVSASGNHDDRMYHALWGEKYVGGADVADYTAHANGTLAAALTGKLLLIHGEVDNNVTPYLSLRLVDALMTANRDFDLLIVPNADHSLVVHQAYWLRRRWDYFVTHLMGAAPPEFEIGAVPFDPERLEGSRG